MIVKNESKVILRSLESVYRMIDSYCICDTGSTDDTINLIQTFFKEKGIEGKIEQEPFRDFGYNRTFALKACENCKKADYLFLLDADMIVEIDETKIMEFKKQLKGDAYLVCQGTLKFHYMNTRLVKNHQGIIYWGVTHEYVKCPDNSTIHKIEKEDLFILDIGDGGCKEDKIVRDIRLLTNGLNELPNNDRYTFYLANSYRDKGDYEIAIEYYKKRIGLQGWMEEVWYSNYMIGNCYKRLHQMENAIFYWLEAYNIFPCRIENLYKLIKYYRIQGKNYLANVFYKIANEERKKSINQWSYLFTELDIYKCKLDFEFSIIGYHSNIDQIDLKKICMKVLSNECVDDVMIRNILSNYKFYSESIEKYSIPFSNNNEKVLKNIGKEIKEIESNVDMISSTPTLCFGQTKKELFIGVRFVNYRIDENGQYINKKNIITINVISKIDISTAIWHKREESILTYDKSYDNYYIGQEDIRFHRMDKKDTNKKKDKKKKKVKEKNNIVYSYNANRCISEGTMNVENGILNVSSFPPCCNDSIIIKNINLQNIEKNWVLFDDNGFEKCIYQWYPLTIGTIDNEKKEFIKTNQLNVHIPPFFKYVRGSSNGIIIKDEIWFLCHIVSYEDRRFYYHLIIVLDKNTLALKSYTNLWTFEQKSVEYTLGMVLLDDCLLIGYSLNDCQSKYMMVPKITFDSMMMI